VVHFSSHVISGRRFDWRGRPPRDPMLIEVIERRRQGYLGALLPSPDAERLIEGYLASPEGRAETAGVAARLRLSGQAAR
jgi:hypothetical protein